MKKQPAGKKWKPRKPVEISKEELALLNRWDFTELEYYDCEKIRRKKVKTPQEAKRLADHDAEEVRVQCEAEKVLREAHEALDRGTSLLLKVIRSGKLTTTLFPTEKGIAAGVRPSRDDTAVECLSSRIDYLNRQLIRLAETNAPKGCWHFWFQAKELATAFLRLALLHPEEFREVAESSLTMPSLRGRNPDYTADAEAIVKAIHLAENHPAPDIWDNRMRVGALCHPIVASILDDIFSQRREYQWEKDGLARMKEFYETAEEYRDMTLEQYLQRWRHPTRYAHLIACAALPDWKDNPAAWWKGRVLPMVKEEFQRLADDHTRNPALWSELKRGGERDTTKDMRRYMEKICRNKFNQFAQPSP